MDFIEGEQLFGLGCMGGHHQRQRRKPVAPNHLAIGTRKSRLMPTPRAPTRSRNWVR